MSVESLDRRTAEDHLRHAAAGILAECEAILREDEPRMRASLGKLTQEAIDRIFHGPDGSGFGRAA